MQLIFEWEAEDDLPLSLPQIVVKLLKDID